MCGAEVGDEAVDMELDGGVFSGQVWAATAAKTPVAGSSMPRSGVRGEPLPSKFIKEGGASEDCRLDVCQSTKFPFRKRKSWGLGERKRKKGTREANLLPEEKEEGSCGPGTDVAAASARAKPVRSENGKNDLV